MYLPVALSIAGSDSSGGAGIQADLKTFYSLGVHGACVITSITSQNTMGVMARHDLAVGVVASQLRAVLEDIEVEGAKTGMLGNGAVVEAVADILAGHGTRNLVVDPVAFSSSGQPLLDEVGMEVMVEELLPLATVFTPNLMEASALLGGDIRDLEGMMKAARSLRKLGPACVVIKGGHLASSEKSIDIFYDGNNMLEIEMPRVRTENDHGTGCVFSAAITARLALGEAPLQAVTGAKGDVTRALVNSLSIGSGRGPVHPLPQSGESGR
jgi:hydroxymethylpyrimidine kinase/phosphomethylpyrimidine kinase